MSAWGRTLTPPTGVSKVIPQGKAWVSQMCTSWFALRRVKYLGDGFLNHFNSFGPF